MIYTTYDHVHSPFLNTLYTQKTAGIHGYPQFEKPA
jgi:hypothetical protein